MMFVMSIDKPVCHANAGRTCRAIYRVDDNQVGLWSLPVSVAVLARGFESA